mgnify:CR=1 FL=1|tara:strand:- start:89 stop:805 length:717 start_codon:yes stop_codon:yes gene_type:complete
MKFNNKFKVGWWIFLILLTGGLFAWRLEAIGNGNSAPVDIFIFLILVALLLAPIFSEIEFFGIKLKRELEELKSQIKLQFGDLRNDIRNSQVQTIHQNITGFGPPPSDDELPELDIKVERLIREKLKDYNLEPDNSPKSKIYVPRDNTTLFKIRYNLEIELRRIWDNKIENVTQRKPPLNQIIRDLTSEYIIDKQFYQILREILSVCNYAIHGEKVSKNQIEFVEKNSDDIIDFLKRL